MKEQGSDKLAQFYRRAKDLTIKPTKLLIQAGALSLILAAGSAVAHDVNVGASSNVTLKVLMSEVTLKRELTPEKMTKMAKARRENRLGVPLSLYAKDFLPQSVLDRNKDVVVLERSDNDLRSFIYWTAATADGFVPDGYKDLDKLNRKRLAFLLSMSLDRANATVVHGNRFEGEGCIVVPLNKEIGVSQYLQRTIGLTKDQIRPFSREDDRALQSTVMRHELMHCNTSMSTEANLVRLPTALARKYAEALADQAALMNTIVDGGNDKRILPIMYQSRVLSELDVFRTPDGKTVIRPQQSYLTSYTMQKVIATGRVSDQNELLGDVQKFEAVLEQASLIVDLYEKAHPENAKQPKLLRIANAFQAGINNYKNYPPFFITYYAQYLDALHELAPKYAQKMTEPTRVDYRKFFTNEYKTLKEYGQGRLSEMPNWPKTVKPYVDPLTAKEKRYILQQKFVPKG